jgi:hypothetical protein
MQCLTGIFCTVIDNELACFFFVVVVVFFLILVAQVSNFWVRKSTAAIPHLDILKCNLRSTVPMLKKFTPKYKLHDNVYTNTGKNIFFF